MKSMTVIPPSDNRIAQLIDANLDRAREGLRVIEDWCRFGLKKKDYAKDLKDWRQTLGTYHHEFYKNARTTFQDPCIGISHPAQSTRITPEQIVSANASRVQEALRVIEEYTRNTDKLLSSEASSIRYKIYDLELQIIKESKWNERKKILEECTVYLITNSNQSIAEIIHEILSAGVRVVQYRGKHKNDLESIKEANLLSAICKKFNALFIINDRVDIALATNADGVHLGQNDMPITEARKILGPHKIIGKSTHSKKQIEAAVKEGCDYIGIGPIFNSNTKPELIPIGISSIKEAIKSSPLPTFAIGGINTSNINQIKNTGCKRIALSEAIMNHPQPISVTKKLINLLK